MSVSVATWAASAVPRLPDLGRSAAALARTVDSERGLA